ncbi:TetR family transcriptional regulator, partial [Acinetobacter baumannii]|nr:TetR family transcriptional regulator [Acinetobacter baumannii]
MASVSDTLGGKMEENTVLREDVLA